MAKRVRALLGWLASMELTLVCLLGFMVLVVACTLAQPAIGVFGAVKTYIRSVFVVWRPAGASWGLPVFPGGGFWGVLLMLNLVTAQFARLELSWRKSGLWVVHVGLLVLFGGEFVTGLFQRESRMVLEEGKTTWYVEDAHDLELAIADPSPADHDRVARVPESRLRGRVADPRLPFAFFADYHDGSSDGTLETRAERAALRLQFADGGEALLGAGRPRAVSIGGKDYRLELRSRREYLPYSLTLRRFRRELHPGTGIPRHFSSEVVLSDPARGERRDLVIAMNEPLRHAGLAFYQASFDRNDTVSILQVVANPGWLLPYLSCVLVTLGLAVHFVQRFRPGRAS